MWSIMVLWLEELVGSGFMRFDASSYRGEDPVQKGFMLLGCMIDDLCLKRLFLTSSMFYFRADYDWLKELMQI